MDATANIIVHKLARDMNDHARRIFNYLFAYYSKDDYAIIDVEYLKFNIRTTVRISKDIFILMRNIQELQNGADVQSS